MRFSSMRFRKPMLMLLFLSVMAAAAKDKKQVLLPADILKARTVCVIVDPAAGVSIEDPNANRIARANVEKALFTWGRLEPVTDAQHADLIIVVRKGRGKIADGTIAGTQVNRPPPLTVQSSGAGIHGAGGGGNRGMQENPMDASSSGGPPDASDGYPSRPTPQAEIGASQDMLVVYRNRSANALSAPPVWRYLAKDALESPDVPAVAVFHNLMNESDKQLAGKP